MISNARQESEEMLATVIDAAAAAAEKAERSEAERAQVAVDAKSELSSEVAALTAEIAELRSTRTGIIELFQAELAELRTSAAAALRLAQDGIDAAASQARNNLDEVVARLTAEAATSLESFNGGVDVLLDETPTEHTGTHSDEGEGAGHAWKTGDLRGSGWNGPARSSDADGTSHGL
jgi:hypothetical protein